MPHLPPATQVAIVDVQYHGNGCRSGSVASDISPDRQAFTLLFSDYLVDSSTRQGRPYRKACDVTVDFNVPPHWQFTVYSVQVRGYASLQAGAIGVQKVFTNGHGGKDQIGRQKLVGPFDDNYETDTDIPLAQAEWSNCHGQGRKKVMLKTSIVVRPAQGFKDEDGDVDKGSGSFPAGMMTLDSLDGGVKHTYGLAWRPCT